MGSIVIRAIRNTMMIMHPTKAFTERGRGRLHGSW